MNMAHIYDRFLRQDKLPHIWCSGCGNGIVTNALIRAIDKTGIDPDKVVVVAGVGCSARANGYLNFCGLHTNYGRPLAYATGANTKTTVYGNIDAPFDLCRLAEAAGTTYVARSTVYHVQLLIDQIARGIEHKGFSVIEAMSDCPTLYGRLNKLGGAPEMLARFKEQAVTLKQAAVMSAEEKQDKLLIGTFVDRKDRLEYTTEYGKVIARAEGKA